ncbi:hypothetical protein JL720_6518 [Aureococcus anophagefferens]|nr:hypothetical protein JL720_6518 [Aureococcus anophagefferens]
MTATTQDPEIAGASNDSERIERLRAQRAADREARRAQHLMATSGGAPMDAAQAAAERPDPERFAAAGLVPTDETIPRARVLPGRRGRVRREDIRKNKEQIAGWEQRATSVVDMLAEAQRKIDEAMNMAELDDE